MPRSESALGSSGDARAERSSGLSLRAIRIALAVVVALALALLFAVPREAPPAAALDQPGEAFVDRVGLVSADYAHAMAGAFQRDPRFQMAVFVEAAPTEGRRSGWTTAQASAWRIGSARGDGIVMFVFPDARVARIEVGYALEADLPDVLVRRMLDGLVAPRFAAGDFEGGIDAFHAAVGEALGGEAERHRLLAELGGEPAPNAIASLLAVYAEGWTRAPRTLAAGWRAYLEGGLEERLAILIVTVILLAIALAMLAIAASTLHGAWRRFGARAASPEQRGPDLFELGFGVVAVALMALVLMLAMSLIGDHLHRQGDFSGAGAEVDWSLR
jgi:uncharacterized membrane protein YgcG